jgi:hypothetical protein
VLDVYERKFNGPGDGKTDYVDEQEAAGFFHVHEDTLEEWIEDCYPWVRCRKMGKKNCYHAADIAALNHIIGIVGPPPPRPKSK